MKGIADMTSLKNERRGYADKTPLIELKRFSAYLGDIHVYLKCDHQLLWGGSKTRKLDFLLQDALDKGSDTLVTGGTAYCNHNLIALLAAKIENLACYLVIESWAKRKYDLKDDRCLPIYQMAGADHIEVIDSASAKRVDEIAAKLLSEGRKPYIISRGGSNEIGNQGYYLCAQEILEQAEEINIVFDYLFCPSGTGGTHAGLATGFAACEHAPEIFGVCVNQKPEPQESIVLKQARQLADYLGIDAPSESAITCLDQYIGEGYALPAPSTKNAIRMLMLTEGVFLDPVYNGKEMAALIDMHEKGLFKKDANIVFLHTGGLTPFYDYSLMLDKEVLF